MEKIRFREADRQQMQAFGIDEAQVRAQLELFRQNASLVELCRPCTLGDGIHRLDAATIEAFHQEHQAAAGKGRFVKFVPASGAATRMFQSLLQIYHLPHYLDPYELCRKAKYGVAVTCDFLRFLDGLERFAFRDDLEGVLAEDGLALSKLVSDREYRTILEYLLTDRGLNYGNLPKGLLKFHRNRDGCCTAFEEHLEEAVQYVADRNGTCRLHFTVSPDHEAQFRALLAQVRSSHEARHGVRYEVRFSHQRSATHTVAVDMRNRLFRDRFGRLVFRPGGHGALLHNLQGLDGDLVYIKNVDNVVQDRFRDVLGSWKRILGGFLVALEKAVHERVRALRAGIAAESVAGAEAFARDQLLVQFPQGYAQWPLSDRHGFVVSRLDRPLRVCGVVQNVGEPGGAPFWVKDATGECSIQIVEKAQVDASSPEQLAIWNSSTHFNPVDLVCSVRNHEGNPFDLKDYVDPHAVFISKKSVEGRSLKALELPGLWNGAMASWLSVIVEVPRITFNPVKTVFDLLKPEHQPE